MTSRKSNKSTGRDFDFEIPGMENQLPNANVNDVTKSNQDDVAKPVKRQTEHLDDITENNRQIDQLYQSLIDKDWSTWEKLTNRGMYSQVQKVRKELLQRSSQYRLAFYSKILDTRLDSLSEKCEAGLKMVKAHYRSQVSSFLMAKMEELVESVKQRQVNFIELMKGKYDYMRELEDYPSLQEKYRSTIFQEEERYLKFLDKLIENFESIIDEELESYS